MPADAETTPLTITVNGSPEALSAGATLPDLLRAHDLDPERVRGVAVAVNDDVIRRADWAQTALRDGDRVEIVTARQGG